MCLDVLTKNNLPLLHRCTEYVCSGAVCGHPSNKHKVHTYNFYGSYDNGMVLWLGDTPGLFPSLSALLSISTYCLSCKSQLSHFNGQLLQPFL